MKYTERCPSCDNPGIVTTWQDDILRYGVGSDAVDLPVHIPVGECASCGFQFTDGEAEEIQETAVARYRDAQKNPNK